MAVSTDITWLRGALNERIPSQGTEADTRFSDVELGALLDSESNRLLAAAEGWLQKATIVLEERQVTKYKLGDESYEYLSPRELHAECIKMYELYLKRGNGGSRMLRSEVKTSDNLLNPDFSRLVGDINSWSK